MGKSSRTIDTNGRRTGLLLGAQQGVSGRSHKSALVKKTGGAKKLLKGGLPGGSVVEGGKRKLLQYGEKGRFSPVRSEGEIRVERQDRVKHPFICGTE